MDVRMRAGSILGLSGNAGRGILPEPQLPANSKPFDFGQETPDDRRFSASRRTAPAPAVTMRQRNPGLPALRRRRGATG